MSKLMMIILAIVMTGGIAFAAVTTGTFGDQNSNKIYRMQVDTDGVIYAPQDTKISIGTSSPTASLEIYGGTPVAGSAIAANDVYFGKDMEVDGAIYVPNYKSTTGMKHLCVRNDGLVVSSVNTCGGGT